MQTKFIDNYVNAVSLINQCLSYCAINKPLKVLLFVNNVKYLNILYWIHTETDMDCRLLVTGFICKHIRARKLHEIQHVWSRNTVIIYDA